MNLLELPRPDDPELEVLHERELYERHLVAARAAVRTYPETAARVIAEVWLKAAMLNAFRRTLQ